jgi:hypothetical protein
MKTVIYNSTGANSARFSSDLPELDYAPMRLESKTPKVKHVVNRRMTKYAQRSSPYAPTRGRISRPKVSRPTPYTFVKRG